LDSEAGALDRPSESGIRIGFYDDWMLPQVIEMFSAEYTRDPESEQRAFLDFYEHPFQRQHGIRLVALDGRRVCGFQSFFSWPYIYQGRQLDTFQSGRSLVSPDYRGRGIFARLLDFLWESGERPDIDFLMGFPVKMSYGSFIRNGWVNPVDLTWYARPIHPLTTLLPKAADATFEFDRDAETVVAYYSQDCFTLSKHPEFAAWRRTIRTGKNYYYFHYRHKGGTIRFELKPNRRGRINELIIGDIVRDSGDPELLRTGIRRLVHAAKRHRFVTALTTAINAQSMDSTLRASLQRAGFVPMRRRIYFIVKQISQMPEIEDPRNWWLLRGDIDTW
jgi:GNAT superfamily N-acetyltransferase